MKKTIVLMLLIFFIFSIFGCVYYYKELIDIKETNTITKEMYYENDLIDSSENIENKNNKENDEVKFGDLLALNKDIIGWINISNTKIDYPVVQTENNDYYLDNNVLGERSSEGAIFMDFRNSIGDSLDDYSSNTIIYGHNMKNGTMFKDLIKFKDQEFFIGNNVIILDTIYEETEWEIFSVYVTDTDFYYIQTDFENSEEFAGFLAIIKGKSLYKNDVQVNSNDKILTLSTCSYEFNDARFVVHAKKRVCEKIN